MSARERTRTLPVANLGGAFELELLIEEQRLNFSGKVERGDRYFPTRGVGGARCGFPRIDWGDGEVGGLKGRGGALDRDPSARRCGIGLIAWVAHPIEHQLLAGVELKAKPVPPLLIFGQGRGGEFVIEPRESRDRNFFAIDFKLAFGFKPSEGVVVAGIARGRGFPAEAFIALQGQRLQRLAGES